MVKNIFLFLFLLSFLVASSQCLQENKANEYKIKAEKISKNELKKKSAFLQFAKYYEYACECEKGTAREEELISLINRLVDVNVNYHHERYGVLEKIYKCKTLKSSKP
jgi:hypothetical protein